MNKAEPPLVLAVVALLAGAAGYALGSFSEPEVIEVDREVVKWKTVKATPEIRIEYRDLEVPAQCERSHADDPQHAGDLRRLAALEAEIGELTAPELTHPLTGSPSSIR